MNDTRPVVNASPLIFLSRGDALDLLRLLGPEIVIPRPVFDEIRQYGDNDVTARSLLTSSWLVIVDPPAASDIITAWDLGRGETSVLSWAHVHSGSEAILDDLAARRCAATLGIPVRGTLGLVLLARQRGVIARARPLIERLVLAGMYLSPTVIDRALSLVDE